MRNDSHHHGVSLIVGLRSKAKQMTTTMTVGWMDDGKAY